MRRRARRSYSASGPRPAMTRLEPLVRGRALESGDEVVDALRPREPREEQHVAVALEARARRARRRRARGSRSRYCDVSIAGYEMRMRSRHCSAKRVPWNASISAADGDDELAGVLRDGDAVVLREVAREDVGGGAEPALLDARAHDVRDIRPHRLGDRRDVHGQAGAPRGAHGVGDRDRVRAEVERQAHRRHAVGEELDEAAGDAGEVAAVGHLVVADGLGTLDDDARRCTAACGRGASAAGPSPRAARSAR